MDDEIDLYLYVAYLSWVNYFDIIFVECGEGQKFNNTSVVSEMDFNNFRVSEKYSQRSLQDN